MKISSLILTSLMFTSGLSFGSEPCERLQNKIDTAPDLNHVVQYLKVEVEKQNDLRQLFECLADDQRLPTELLAADRDFIYGNGWGSVYANAKVPFWNQFQSQLGRSIWGGKILKKSADGVNLLNVMLDRKTMSYAAEVIHAPSLIDGLDSVVLDYRSDTTVPLVSPVVIQRVRDELREVSYRNEKTGIYLGRAYIYTGAMEERFSPEWQNDQRFFFAANFILDFRTELQQDIPSWALPFFE